MFVLLVRVELEGLETDSDVALSVGIHHPGVRLDTIPRVEEVKINGKTRLRLPLRSRGLNFKTNFLIRRIF